MPRLITEAEKFFIVNSDDDDATIASQIDGVGVKTVAKIRKDNPRVVTESLDDEVSDSMPETKTEPNRFAVPEQADPKVLEAMEIAAKQSEVVDARDTMTPKVQQNVGLKVDDLMGRRQKPDGTPDRTAGIVVMTPQASELADDRNYRRPYKENDVMPDARDVLAVRSDPQAGSRNRHRIHKIRPNEPSN